MLLLQELQKITSTTFPKAARNRLLVSTSFFSMVPLKLRRKLSSSKSGIFESEVKAALIRASSEAEEFKTLFNFKASDLLGLLDMERVGDSDVFTSILFLCATASIC